MQKMCLSVAAGILICTFVNTNCVSAKEKIQYNDEIKSYVTFLEKQNQKPVDYVMGLFEKYDIVILCERMHPERTQYDLFYDIVSDKRFVDKVGNVFTEIGTSSMNDCVHDFMFKDGLSDAKINKKALYIYRNLSWTPIWENYGYFDFLKKAYSLNNSKPVDSKINIYFSDMPFQWKGATKESFEKFRNTLGRRDRVMADQIIKQFNKIKESPQKRKKALVIMNYRHAFNDFRFADGNKGDNVGRYLFEAFPGKVSNVMLNAMALLPGTTDQKSISTAINKGKWDAAFEAAGNRDLGFDFNGSPFGADYFDYFPFIKHNLTYKDAFTGFIFYKPLKEHKLVVGIPGLFGDGYDKIILKRMEIFGKPIDKKSTKEFIEQFGKIRELKYDNLDDISKQINQWLTSPKSN